MARPDFIPQLRLIFQGSINIENDIHGTLEYKELKIYLKNVDPKCTLNGQIIKTLEPCCGDRTKQNPQKEAP